ncbi:MAG: hypothetical protein QOI10_3796 [Solirubrobacterales bacterium]|nr:hypothetical protein [Solirubrobacterales bacterium]
MKESKGVSCFEHLEALLANPVLYELGDLIPPTEPEQGGRPRTYPGFAIVLYGALISVFRSARRVESELSHPDVWAFVRVRVKARFPTEPSRWLPEAPIRRHHYTYARNRYLEKPGVWQQIKGAFEERAAVQAVAEMGLCDPDGPGSLTHPDLSRMLYADGKVVTPLFKAKPGTMKTDRDTGELREARSDPDGHLHITGSGEPAWGVKFVLAACRTDGVHGRMILGLDWVPKPGQEAAVAMDCVSRLGPRLPGAHGVLYDGAFRGVHLQRLLRDVGLLPVVPVTAASGGRKAGKPRTERTVSVGEGTIRRPDGGTESCRLFSRAGSLGLGELDEAGDIVFAELRRTKTFRRQNSDGTWRWYNDYEVPAESGGGTVRVRLDTTDDDRSKKFNRTESLRPIPPADPDYRRLYPRRSDVESINRALDDSMWLGRAHSVGHARQLVDLLGFGLMVNSLALHRRRGALEPPGELPAAA